MPPKSQRVNLKKSFKWISSGQAVFTKFTKLWIKYGDNQDPRFGVTASTRFFKKAHQRNRAKRITYQVLKSLVDQLPQNVNIIALPKREVLGVKSKDLAEDLKSGLEKQGLIHEVVSN